MCGTGHLIEIRSDGGISVSRDPDHDLNTESLLHPEPARAARKGLPIIRAQEIRPMTYNDILNMAADAAASFRGHQLKRRTIQQLGGDDFERHPAAQQDDIFFPGARPGTEYIPGFDGFGAQMLRAAEGYQLFDVDYHGKWTQRVGDELPARPRGLKFDKARKGLYDPDGHAVLRKVYLDFLRRDDPRVYTLLLEGPQAPTYDAWLEEAFHLTDANGAALPFYGARWRWFLAKIESSRGAIFTNWRYELKARFGDDDPEAPTRREYLAARSILHGEAPAAPLRGGMSFTSGRQSEPPDYDVPPHTEEPPAPPPFDDMPDWMR
jgi:hypothetical protein